MALSLKKTRTILMPVPQEIKNLIDRFNENRASYSAFTFHKKKKPAKTILFFGIILMFGILGGCVQNPPFWSNWVFNNPYPKAYNLSSIAYGNNLFVAVGADSFLTSPDGITWSKTASDLKNPPSFITYVNNQFIAIGYGTIQTSLDGITWTTRTSSSLMNQITSLAYGNNVFVAMGVYGVILTSPDCSEWTARNSDSANWICSVTFGNNLFVATGFDMKSGFGLIQTSSDGMAWTEYKTANWTPLQSVAFGQNLSADQAGQFVTVGYANGGGDFGGGGVILTSPDGMTWTARYSNTLAILSSVAFGNNLSAGQVGQFVAVGSDLAIVRSTDGINWNKANSGNGNLTSVTYGDNKFVAVGSSGAILTSPDGTIWTARNAD
jgi:hypothetical protein